MTANINWNSLASEYASEHQSRQNQLCHMIGIPLILLALVKLTQWPKIFPWIALGLAVVERNIYSRAQAPGSFYIDNDNVERS